jgi:hypothetical protein
VGTGCRGQVAGMYRIILAAVMIVAATSLLSAEEIKGPKIFGKEMKFDFGKVVQGSEATHIFEIVNKGSELLVIDRVVSS